MRNAKLPRGPIAWKTGPGHGEPKTLEILRENNVSELGGGAAGRQAASETGRGPRPHPRGTMQNH